MADYFRAAACRPSSISATPNTCPLEEMRALHDYALRDRARASAMSSWATGSTSIRTRGPRACTSCAAASTTALGFLGFAVSARCRRRPAIRSTSPTTICASRRGIPGADLRRHDRPGRGPARRRRRHSRLLPSAPSRLGRRAQSELQDRRRAPRLAVAGRDDRRADAQAQHLVRAARLVAEVSHAGPQARDPAPAQGPHPVRRRLSAVHLRAARKDWRAEGYAGRRSRRSCSTRTPSAFCRGR